MTTEKTNLVQDSTTCGLMFRERYAFVSSIEASMTGPQCQAEGPGKVRDIKGEFNA